MTVEIATSDVMPKKIGVNAGFPPEVEHERLAGSPFVKLCDDGLLLEGEIQVVVAERLQARSE